VIVVVGQPVLRNLGDRVDAVGSAARIATAAAGGGSTVQLVGKVGEDPDGDVLVLALAAAGVGHVAVLRDPSRRTPRLVAPTRDAGYAADAVRAGDAADAVRAGDAAGAGRAGDVAEVGDAADGVLGEAEAAEMRDAADGVLGEALDGEAEPARIEPADAADRPSLDSADIDLGLRYLTEFSVLVVAVPVDEAVGSIVSAAAGWASATLIVLVEDGAAVPTGLPSDAIVLQASPPDPDGTFDILVGDLAASIDRGVPARDAFRELLAAAGWEPAEA
jgi:hypothetical protein